MLLPIALILLTEESSFANRVTNTSAPNYEVAASQNATLKASLNWSFGGKSQRGWQLYQPLVCQLIGVDETADAVEFASALSRWQSKVRLEPSGVLNQETWQKMVATWQARRRNDQAAPTANQLQLVSSAEFYDPERPEELRRLDRQAYQAYRKMIAAAAADLSLATSEKYLKIVSAFRSPEYQAQLRRQSPRAGRAGLALHSPHSTGLALDLYVGGEPVSTRDDNRALQMQTKVYRWLVKNAGNFGFCPYFYEPWHWEYRPQ